MKKLISRRQFMQVCGVSAAVASLAACGSDSSSASTATSTAASAATGDTAAAEPVTLKVMYNADNEQTMSTYESIVAAYMEQKPNVTVELIPVPYADQRTYLTTQYTANQAPDVFYEIDHLAISDYEAGWICDISHHYEEKNPYDDVIWKDELDSSIYERMVMADGAIPGYPTSTGTVRLYCNMAHFKAAGVGIPTTWREFMDACAAIQETGVIPFAFANATSADIPWFWFNNSLANQLQPDLIKKIDTDGSGFIVSSEMVRMLDSGSDVDFTGPAIQKSFDLMKEFSQYWTSDYNSLDTATSHERFATQDVAMTVVHTSSLSVITELINDGFEYGVMPIPTVTKEEYPDALGKSVVLGGQPDGIYVVNKALEGDEVRYNAAIDLIHYMSSRDVEFKFLDEAYVVPLNKNISFPESMKGYIITEEPLRMQVYGWDDNIRNTINRGGQMFLEGGIDGVELGEMLNEAYVDFAETQMDTNGWSADNDYGDAE